VGVVRGHHRDTVRVGHDDVPGADDLPAAADGDVDLAGAVLVGAARHDARGPDGEVGVEHHPEVAHRTVGDHAGEALALAGDADETAVARVLGVALRADHQHVTGL